MLQRTTGLRLSRIGALCSVTLLCACAWLATCPRLAAATELVRDAYYWYAPEHEKYSRSEFFSQPDFRSGQVRINRTQRFQFLDGQRGWALLVFDGGTQAFIHLRILRTLLWNPAASDPWYEFERASVFPEEPAKIEARLKPVSSEPETANSKVPVWKRYREGWSINKGRGQPGEGNTDGLSTPTQEKRRSKYPLLPPIGPQPPTGNTGQPVPDNEAP